MLLAFGLLATGLIILVAGARALVKGASGIAVALGVPPLIIGLTLVAFGTSAPELVLSLTAAWKGETGLLFGNVVGASSMVIGVVLALSALIATLKCDVSIITREIPMTILAVTTLLVLGSRSILNGLSETDAYTRADGVMLLLVFGVFVHYTLTHVLRQAPQDPALQQAQEYEQRVVLPSIGANMGLLALGLVGVGVGARLAVANAVVIAQTLGVPEPVVGLTIVSFGTTLPELATSVMAAKRGQGDLAIGNVVGSIIFNVLFVLGLASLITPIPVPPLGHVDLLFLVALTIVLLPLAWHQRRVDRVEGAFLAAVYLAYAAWRGLASY
jgi:cation:H+ antiporter